MGKSDPIILEEYARFLESEISLCNSVAFLGFNQENSFTLSVKASVRHFYDAQLNNWDINDNWSLKQNYDLIVCTRCAYFSKEPLRFIEKCKQHLNNAGIAMIDWGLGDHWRFNNYKVGWLRNGEHEFAYKQENFLYSCFWNENLRKDINVELFWNHILTNKKFGYTLNNNLEEVIREEVPSLVDYDIKKIKTIFLWPESPQLYIITLIQK